MEKCIIQGIIKANIMKEALASCQMEGIGNNLTLKDLYLEGYREKKVHKNLHNLAYQ